MHWTREQHLCGFDEVCCYEVTKGNCWMYNAKQKVFVIVIVIDGMMYQARLMIVNNIYIYLYCLMGEIITIILLIFWFPPAPKPQAVQIIN